MTDREMIQDRLDLIDSVLYEQEVHELKARIHEWYIEHPKVPNLLLELQLKSANSKLQEIYNRRMAFRERVKEEL